MRELRNPNAEPGVAYIWVQFFGPAAEHNMPCAVCGEKHAVLDCNTGVMQPCWTCQAEGYEIRKKNRFGLYRPLNR